MPTRTNQGASLCGVHVPAGFSNAPGECKRRARQPALARHWENALAMCVHQLLRGHVCMHPSAPERQQENTVITCTLQHQQGSWRVLCLHMPFSTRARVHRCHQPKPPSLERVLTVLCPLSRCFKISKCVSSTYSLDVFLTGLELLLP